MRAFNHLVSRVHLDCWDRLTRETVIHVEGCESAAEGLEELARHGEYIACVAVVGCDWFACLSCTYTCTTQETEVIVIVVSCRWSKSETRLKPESVSAIVSVMQEDKRCAAFTRLR